MGRGRDRGGRGRDGGERRDGIRDRAKWRNTVRENVATEKPMNRRTRFFSKERSRE